MLFEFPISIVGVDMGFHNPIPTSWKNFAVWGQGAALTKIMAFLGQPAFSGSMRVQRWVISSPGGVTLFALGWDDIILLQVGWHYLLWAKSVSEKAMAPHSSTLAWKIPWTEEPGRLQSMGSRRVGHDWATSLSLFTFLHWRRKWQPTPVFLPGESQKRGSPVGCRLWGRTE